MSDDGLMRRMLERILDSDCTPEEACSDRPELLPRLRRRLERMRSVENQIDALFPSSEGANSKLAGEANPSPKRPLEIPGYDVLGSLGHGGMGVVYKARHLKLNRLVALKMLLSGAYASPKERARFALESQAIAELQHPNVVQVFDVGEHEGRLYFTMEFVEGGTLAQALGGTPQPARKAAELLLPLAAAVQAAHEKGIIHRDLKPANVLLAGDGTPKIGDFGLARRVDGDASLTMADARVGTPSYMAPEQALGALGVVGPSVDIYALGAVLYEALTGRPPFRAATATDTERQVIMSEPAPPSQLNGSVPRDLETVCLKCLQKDPSKRYASAAEFAQDLRRFLDGIPVRARRVGYLERARRWSARNRAVAAALASVLILTALFAAGSGAAAWRFRNLEAAQRDLARENGALAEQRGRLVSEKEQERAKAASAETREAQLRQLAESHSREFRRNLYFSEMSLAGQAASVPSGLGRVHEILERWREDVPDLRGWEWYYLNGLCHRSVATRILHAQTVHAVAWSPDGRRLASAGADRTICICNPSDDSPPLRLRGHSREVLSLAWSPDGGRLATAGWDGTVRLWDTQDGTELSAHLHGSEVFAVAWSPDGATIAYGGHDRAVHLWDPQEKIVRLSLAGHQETVCSLSWSPDGSRLASSARDGTARIWDVAAGKEIHLLIGHQNWVNGVAWSPDGARLATASNDQTLKIWNAEDGKEIRTLRGHTQGVSSICWSPDGSRVASSGDDQTVRVWSAETGEETLQFRGHMLPLTSVAWSPDGHHIASAAYDKSVRVWDAASAAETPELRGHDRAFSAICWNPRDADVVASADGGGTILLWNLNQNESLKKLRADEHRVRSLAWHPAGRWIASGSGNGMVRVWDAESGEVHKAHETHQGIVNAVAWSPDGRLLASAGADKTIRVRETASDAAVWALEGHEAQVYALAWSPDGRRLASAAGDRSVAIWNIETRERAGVYRGHVSEVETVAWDPISGLVASAGFDKAIHVWDPETLERKSILRGHTSQVTQIAWRPNGTRLASAGRDGELKLWDPLADREALTLGRHLVAVNGAAWSPDGMKLGAAMEDGVVRIYDAEPGFLDARSPELLSVLDRALTLDPGASERWRDRAETYATMRDWKRAGADARQFLLSNPHLGWFMPDGMVAAPFPAELRQRFAPEEESPFSAASGEKARTRWRTAAFSSQGMIDFGPFTDFGDHLSAYALFPIYALDERRVAILFGSDDHARLWLNGEMLHEFVGKRAATPDEDAVAATLKPGWNALLVKVVDETNDHALYLRLSEEAADLSRLNSAAADTLP